MDKNSLTYQDAGVNIRASDDLIQQIKPLAWQTRRPELLAGLGGFGAFFELPKGYRQPVLVSATDGVGSKILLTGQLQKYDTIGIDLVAMCVNDIIVSGAEPLFFLDYYATSSLNTVIAKEVIEGICHGCRIAGCSLVGGEIAEMPGIYQHNDYDMAGFCVGVVEKNRIIDGTTVKPKDSIIALASSGLHANGYSLVRKILAKQNIATKLPIDLLIPTKIYVKSVLSLIKKFPVHAISHITGGGLIDNIPRILPEGMQAVLNTKSWQIPETFAWLKQQGNIDTYEMYHTFNCGIGMVVIVPNECHREVIQALNQTGETAWLVGSIETGKRQCLLV